MTQNERLAQNKQHKTSAQLLAELAANYKTLHKKYRALWERKKNMDAKYIKEIRQLRKQVKKEELETVIPNENFGEILKLYIESEVGLEIGLKNRVREYIEARGIFNVLMKDYTKHSLKEISNILGGGRDHATIINSINETRDLLETDREFRNRFRKYENFVKENLISFSNDISTHFNLFENPVAISLFDLHGNFIKEFKSIRECATHLGIYPEHINLALQGKSLSSFQYIVKYNGKAEVLLQQS